MATPQTEVVVTVAGLETARLVLTPGDYLIGRNADCPIRVDADLVSRQHARLVINYDHALIEDLGSANGTLINDLPIAQDGRTRLWPNQKIQIGTATISVRRLRHDASDLSLMPSQAVVRRALPEEFLREKKYDIGKVVARGGMGAILDAREVTIERSVAMKVMLDSTDADGLARFLNEAKITGQLEHPNIVPVHELSVDENGQPYYTMKMVRGITLKKVLELMAAGTEATLTKYPLPALLTIFQKVCDALAFAHSKGVIHRDLKPENLMLGDYGEVLVMDWGLAKRVKSESGNRKPEREDAASSDEIHTIRHTLAGADKAAAPEENLSGLRSPLSGIEATLAGTIMGTPQFMSPEQARGEVETLDARSDIYSLGAILYQVLSLRVPVTGTDAMEVVGKVGRGEIEPLQGAGAPSPRGPANSGRGRPSSSRIPDSLAAVVGKAMSLDPAARYATVADLQHDIEAYQTGFATSAENAGAWKRFTLLVKRHKAASIGLAAVLTVGSVFGTKAFIEGRRAERALADLRRQAPALRQLAETEAGFQRFENALDKLDAALALDPNDLPSYWLRAWLLLGIDRPADAVTALVAAQRKDPAHSELASILPSIERIATLPSSERWPTDDGRKIWDHLVKIGASGPVIALSTKLKLAAADNVKLIGQRIDAWLGKSHGVVTKAIEEGVQVTTFPHGVDDLKPLKGLPIAKLSIAETKVTSLEPLRGMKLVVLSISHCNITGLSPLEGMALHEVNLEGALVADLSPLRGMPLKKISIGHTKVVDLSPLAGMPVEEFYCLGRNLVDFSALQKCPLKKVDISQNAATNLDFLASAPIESLDAGGDRIRDLTPLRGKPLKKLLISTNDLSDLSPLRGAPIEELALHRNPRITDLTPLLDLPKLERLRISRDGKAPLEPLRSHPTLLYIAYENDPYRPVAEVWAEYDAQQAAGKK